MSQPDPAADPDAAVRLRALTDFVAVVAGARDHDDVLRQLAAASRQALDADTVALSIWDRSGGVLHTVALEGVPASDEASKAELEQPATLPVVHRLLVDRRGYLATAREDDPATRSRLDRCRCDSAVAVPVVVDGKVWGELWAGRAGDRQQFRESDVQFARTVADHAAPAVRQAEHLGEVERLAYTDPLTKLPNRRSFEDRLADAVAEHARTAAGVGVVVADVNGLKDINDSAGHLAGDAALVRFANLLEEVAASVAGCTPARLGGDEFALMCGGMSGEVVTGLAERLAAGGRAVLPQGAACGLAMTDGVTDDGLTPARILRAADAAQYRAKQQGIVGPVVVNSEFLAGVSDGGQRRRYRDLDHHSLLEDLLTVLDESADTTPLGRLVAVATTAAERLDATGWRVLEGHAARPMAPRAEAFRAGSDGADAGDVLAASALVAPETSWRVEVHCEPGLPAAELHRAELRAAAAVAVQPIGL
jgi:diguanylate cyclase (GGDEF)-like protein